MGKVCTCTSGCVGADFACHASRNTITAANVSFESVTNTGSFLTVPTSVFSSQLTTSTTLDESSRFSLWQVPGSFVGNRKYIISPLLYPDYDIQMSGAGFQSAKQWKAIDVDPDSWFNSGSSDPLQLFWIVCKFEGHVRLGLDVVDKDITGNLQITDRVWLYSGSITNYVYGWSTSRSGDPDDR